MAIDPARAKSLFLNASEMPSVAERGAYLERECGGEPELRARLEALLAAHAAADHTMDATQGSAEEGVAERPARGSGLFSTDVPGLILAGKYKLIERIGEGGMGSVWLAQQSEPVKRKVAVKLIKLGMDSRQVLNRFEAERQALAMMEHPNIAKVLDGGLAPDGRPFFVMELVKGTPITTYCDACKLSLKERLDLFVPVCQAIQHAHQKGIIHRDIKPANVLIALYDDRPVPKVIDFGVAKATGQQLTDSTLNTGFGGVIGTPQYMSPEQATLNNLDIDTRSDVYSLGVLLYELLTGSPPFTKDEMEKKGLMEVLRVVREEEPPKPSTRLSTAATLPSLSANRSVEPRKLTQMLRSELDWIVLKALEKNRARRYETANGLAADVQRYLAGDPVVAHPPSAAYLMSKFVRRHRAQVIGAALVALVLLGGIAGTSFGLLAANRSAQAERVAKQDAEAKRAEAVTQQGRAEANAKLAAESEGRAAANAAEANYQLTRLHIANGSAAQEQNEQFTALLWYLRAWEGDPEPAREAAHRARVGAVLDGTMRLTGVCFHPTGVDDVDIDPMGKRLVTRLMDRDGKRGNMAYIWDYAAGKLATPPLVHEGAVRFAGFSPDGALVLTASEDRTAVVWDAGTGRRMRTQDFGMPVVAAGFSPDGKVVATAVGKEVTFWSPATGEKAGPTIRCPDAVYGIQFSADGRRFLTADRGGRCGWDRATGEAVGKAIAQRVPNSDEQAFYKTMPALNSDGTRMLAINDAARAYDVGTGKQLWQATTDEFMVHWSNDDKEAIISGVTAHFVDGETGAVIHDFKHFRDSAYNAISPAGQIVATGISGGGIYLWDSKTGDSLGPPLQCADFLRQLRFSPDGKRLIAASQDGTARVWELAPASAVVPYQFNCGRADLWVSGNGSSASPDGRTRLQPAEGGALLIRLDGGTAHLLKQDSASVDTRFSGDGKRLATLTKKAVRVWDASSGEPVGGEIPIDQGFELAPHVSISNDGERVAVIYPFRYDVAHPVESERPAAAIVWDAAGRRLFTLPSRIESAPRVFEGKEFDSVVFETAFSPDGRIVVGAVESSSEIAAYDVDTQKRLYRTLAFKGHIVALVISPDGRMVMTAATDALGREFDIQTGVPAAPALRNPNSVDDIAADMDGGKIATIANDHRLRIWDAKTGDLLAIAPGTAHDKCWFSRDGTTVQFMRLGGAWMQYRIPTYAGPREAVGRVAPLIAGRFLDAKYGLTDVGPNEFINNRAAYRKAWLDWQGLVDDPALQP